MVLDPETPGPDAQIPSINQPDDEPSAEKLVRWHSFVVALLEVWLYLYAQQNETYYVQNMHLYFTHNQQWAVDRNKVFWYQASTLDSFFFVIFEF